MPEFIFVRPKDGLAGIFDPQRKDRLPAGKWRRLESGLYWQRLAAMGDVALTRLPPPDSEIEGYAPPPARAPRAKPGEPSPSKSAE